MCSSDLNTETGKRTAYFTAENPWKGYNVPEYSCGTLEEASARWTTSSTPSARTIRTCATLFVTARTSSTPSGTVDPSNLYLLLRRGEDQMNHDNPISRRREEATVSASIL